MTSMKIGQRLSRIGAGRLWLLVQAVAALAAASAAVSFLPFKKAVAFGAIRLGRPSKTLVIRDCVWAVEAAARRVPWRAVCIEKGLVVQRMLRSRGVDAQLHYGARNHPETGQLEAHVWVTEGGNFVIGGEEANGFAPVAAYPRTVF